jgi:hypothetical protein
VGQFLATMELPAGCWAEAVYVLARAVWLVNADNYGERAGTLVDMEKVMADVERDKISEGQIEEAEQDAEDPSHEKKTADREDDQSGNTDVNK